LAELWRSSEHEPLAGKDWSEERAEQAIAAIVADAESTFDGVRWPWHPRDGDENARWSVYMGAAGVIWALHDLGATGWTLPSRSSITTAPSPTCRNSRPRPVTGRESPASVSSRSV
jgi:hypothetical protein